jgi:protein phosphatase
MERRFQMVREVLVERAKDDPSLRGMATTMTVACTTGSELLTAHVGDSRAYVFRDGRLRLLTRDQTVAQSLVDAGAIGPEEAAKHPSRHVLTSALATRGAFVQVELRRTRLQDGDQLLLCSDGLTEMVAEAEIARALATP